LSEKNNEPKSKKAPLRLEKVFQIVGVSQHTFVEPLEFDRLIVALRTPGFAVIVEGPSGIGKTTSVMRVLSKLGMDKTAKVFRCRNPVDAISVAELPKGKLAGTIIIDDFHVLIPETKRGIADYIKLLTDVSNPDVKLRRLSARQTQLARRL
jgi:ABC-type lipoprotein export system ATPase subunit